jgi:hypothetical protein
MACEQQNAEMLWDMVETISRGEMPAGHTADDLRKLGLPQPGELIRDMQPDGTVIIRQIAPKKTSKKPAFACDVPDE